MVTYGNKNAFVGLTIELRTIGPVPITIGTGILGLVGESTRGPASECIAIGMPSSARALYYSGDLKEAAELGFQQGCPVIYAVRVLGNGNAKAFIDVDDGCIVPCTVGTFWAKSEGNWGNGLVLTIANGEAKQTWFKVIPGDGTVGPYQLEVNDIVTSTTNFVKVNGVAKTIVYTSGELGENKVWVNKVDGQITFYSGEAPAGTDNIAVSVKHWTRKVTITDNESKPEIFNNIRDLIALEAAMDRSMLVDFVTGDAMYHLPKNQSVMLSGGDDGDAITTDDWEAALELLGDTIAPTTVAITDYEVETATYDLVASLDGWLTWMADLFKPCLGFIACMENESLENLLDLAAGYNNRLLTLGGNHWDNNIPRRNLAVARAAKEAAVSLGESTAEAMHALNGVRELLTIWAQDDMDMLTRGGVDVLKKERGILPYVGISTATDWQFMRNVDNRTINWIIVACNFALKQFYHKRRTPQILNSIKSTLESILAEQVYLQNVEKFNVGVYPNALDTGRVDIELNLQNIGHIERFRMVMGVGIIEDTSTT